MLGKIRERRRRNREDIDRRLAIVDAAYGLLDGEESQEMTLDDLRAGHEDDINDPVDNSILIQMLERQLDEALKIIAKQRTVIDHQAATIDAAHTFVGMLSEFRARTGEPLFKTTVDDEVSVATLNHRYSDLAHLLNGIGRPVAPKLAQGTVH